MKEPMKMQIFLVARCLLFFCSARHLSFTLTGRQTDARIKSDDALI